MLFWPAKLDDGSYDKSLDILPLKIAIDEDQEYKVSYEGVKYRKLCLRADVHRGLLVRVDDIKFWAMSRAVNAIVTITDFFKFQKWFTKEHDNDQGATS